MNYLLYPFAFYVLLVGFRYLLTFLQLRKLRLQYPQHQIKPADQVPPYLQSLFPTAIQELESLGFQFCTYLQVKPALVLPPAMQWEVLCYHPSLQTYAIAGIRRPVEPIHLFDISFLTFFEDDSLLLTLNGKVNGLLGTLSQTTVQDIYTAQTLLQWQAHQSKLQELTFHQATRDLPIELLVQTLQSRLAGQIDGLIATNKIGSINSSEPFQFSLWAALRKTHDILQGNRKLAEMFKQRQQLAKANPNLRMEVPVELEVEGFQRIEQLQQGLVGRKFRTWLLLGSLALFIASYTSIFSAERLIIFLAVLTFHEGGHLVAMKLSGYRDTSILFVPFLGALATARKHDATLTQKFWISLAGPLPGLVLGVALAIATQTGPYPTWVPETAWTLIGLNFFNLLPLYPLDGGQIADLLLFSRYPYVGVAFKGLGVALLGLLGLTQPMFLMFAGLIALTIPNGFRAAKANVQLQQELRQYPISDREELTHFVFKHLKQMGYDKLPFNTRYVLAKDLLDRYREGHAKWTTRFFLVLLYCGSLLGGLIGSLQAISPQWLQIVSSYLEAPGTQAAQFKAQQQREVEQATAALQTNPDNLQAYQQRANAHTALRNYPGALADYDQIVRLKPDDISPLLNRAELRSRLNNTQGALQDYDQVLRLQPNEVEIYLQRAQLRRHLQDHQGALNDYNTMVRLSPTQAWVYVERGYARYGFKDSQGAIADANQAIQLDPSQPDAYFLRADTRRQLGDQSGAIADEQKATLLETAAEQNE